MTRPPLSQGGVTVTRCAAERWLELDGGQVTITACPYDYWPDVRQVEQPAPGPEPGASLSEGACP